MTFNFAGKKALVTGASRGIGEAIARTLLDLGASVAITSTAKAPGWAEAYPNASHFVLDFQEEESVNLFFRQIEQFGPADILINNAGIHQPQPIDHVTKEVWDRIFLVNLYGPMQLIKYFTPHMKEQRKGRIVNVASIAGTVCKRNASAYSSSKMALIGLTRSSAIDLAPFGVLVNAISPGTTQTEMVDRILSEELKQILLTGIPLGRFATPQEIANCAVFLASDWNTYITGQNIIVDGGTVIA